METKELGMIAGFLLPHYSSIKSSLPPEPNRLIAILLLGPRLPLLQKDSSLDVSGGSPCHSHKTAPREQEHLSL
jgi:hypothetical protein